MEQLVTFRLSTWTPESRGVQSIPCYELRYNEEKDTVEDHGVVKSKKRNSKGEMVNEWDSMEFTDHQVALNPIRDAAKIRWARDCSYNTGAKNRANNVSITFYEYDPLKDIKAQAARRDAGRTVTKYIYSDASEDELLEFALAEGISIVVFGANNEDPAIRQANVSYVQDQIMNLYEAIEKDPQACEHFLAKVQDPLRKTKALVRQGFNKHVLKAVAGRVSWGEKGKNPGFGLHDVGAININDTYNVMAQYFAQPEHADVYEQLQSSLGKDLDQLPYMESGKKRAPKAKANTEE